MTFHPRFSVATKSTDVLLNHVLNPTEQALVGAIVTASYRYVVDFIRTEAPEWLKTLHAEKLIPEFKNMAVEYALARACEKQVLPLSYEWGLIPSTKEVYFKMHSLNEEAVITVNQTRSQKRASRDARFRTALHDEYESRLILFDDEEQYFGETYLELNHGYQSAKPSFVVLGKPNRDGMLYGISLAPDSLPTVISDNKNIKTTANEVAAFGPEEFRRFAFKSNKG